MHSQEVLKSRNLLKALSRKGTRKQALQTTHKMYNKVVTILDEL